MRRMLPHLYRLNEDAQYLGIFGLSFHITIDIYALRFGGLYPCTWDVERIRRVACWG